MGPGLSPERLWDMQVDVMSRVTGGEKYYSGGVLGRAYLQNGSGASKKIAPKSWDRTQEKRQGMSPVVTSQKGQWDLNLVLRSN